MNRLCIILGKGGVGRTTIAAALGFISAKRGKKTLIIEVNGENSVGRLFGIKEPSYNPLKLKDNLYISSIESHLALKEYAIIKLHFEFLYRIVFENPVVGRFIYSLPGMQELLILGKVIYEIDRKENDRPYWDTVILDAPATGHGLGLLDIPNVVINTVSQGPMTEDARHMLDVLKDLVRTKFIAVTLPKNLPLNETVELQNQMFDLIGRRPDAVVVNQVFPVYWNNRQISLFKKLKMAAMAGGMHEFLDIFDVLNELILYQEHERNTLQKYE